MMDSFLQGMGIAFSCIIVSAVVVSIAWWVERQWHKASEFEDWKDGVASTLVRLESTCNHLESQARKSEKAKPRAKRK